MDINIPQDPRLNKQWRLEVLRKANQDSEFRSLIREKCKRDNIFFTNGFCWTYDPRERYPHLPFILYPKQEELFNKLDEWLWLSQEGERINAILDKPRGVGATYSVMTWGLHKFLFDDFSMRVGSRKEDYVDKKGDPDTLFHKLDYNLERLPWWLLPEGFTMRGSRSSMILKHPDPYSANDITGESANPNFGRGGRKSITVFDELGFWEWAQSSWESSGESTNFRIAMSTPPEAGKDSYFYKLNIGEKGKVFRFEFDWNDVPKRDSEWFKKAKESKSEEEFAREVMKSYEGTVRGKVYAADMRFVRMVDELEPNGKLPIMISWDFGLDTVAMIWYQFDPVNRWIYMLDAYHNSNKAIDFYVPFVTGVPKSGTANYDDWELEMMVRHRLWGREVTHFGDPSVKQRHVKDGGSTLETLEVDHGIYIQHRDWAGRSWKDLRDITRPFFRRITAHEKRCEYAISAIRNAKYPKRMEGSQSTAEAQKPVHDWSSHYRTAHEYFCDNIYDEEADTAAQKRQREKEEQREEDEADLNEAI